MDSYHSNNFINYLSDIEYYSCKFSPFSKNLIACAQSQYYGIIGNGRVSIYEFDMERRSIIEIKRFPTNEACFDIAWSESNENIISSAQGDGTLKIWDLNNNYPYGNLKCHSEEIYCVNWNINQPELILTSSQDMTIKLHDANKLITINTYLGHKGIVYNSIWHPTLSGVFASTSEDGTFKIWDMKSNQIIKSIKAHNSHAMSCDFNKYNNILATAGSDGTLALWDLKSTSTIPLLCIKAHDLTIKKLVFSPFSQNILGSVGYDMNMRLWNVEPFNQIEIFKHHKEFVLGLDFSNHENSLVATCGWDRALNIFTWDKIKLI